LSQKLKWYIFVRSGFQYHIILITITHYCPVKEDK